MSVPPAQIEFIGVSERDGCIDCRPRFGSEGQACQFLFGVARVDLGCDLEKQLTLRRIPMQMADQNAARFHVFCLLHQRRHLVEHMPWQKHGQLAIQG